ncbi:hypothetical protein [Cytophaga hutchinsonii]|uniref:Uncharacterized protein n=1 Tax=Cytophaga hutchinsonii (strain ATCC 33406 / DSM 1761 / CIP 103989 / NBRC 15051 / NCIMB 9469 / D465) TaxID=269798 RepID=A0A6N4STC1_CYTH3|nr:hypothetical protein [Cytophaga hutchinsonii]ABG59627.1 hypothetical protein CHU_2369 [Cytophaga hutchinsonii ATCC 33406]SFX67002.1 hypothetical protein SAMN04487930_107163 [Cytophaga hutchinsonii ATCC 33406]
MILGVYWYFDFPYNLYTYDYFTYRKGLGGHADAPAELEVIVETDQAANVIQALRELVDQYADAFVFIYRSGKYLQIGTGSYNMHDYDFEIALKMEVILKNMDARKVAYTSLKDAELIRLYHVKNDHVWPTKKYFSMVASSLMKYNAETSCIRFDCNAGTNEKEDFLNEILVVTAAANIHVVFYKEKKCGDRHNLMLFFTNGRQGVGLKPKQKVDVASFEVGMEALIQKYTVKIGLIGGFDENYPEGDFIVLKMVDAEFILD